jgi:hypothetical protein
MGYLSIPTLQVWKRKVVGTLQDDGWMVLVARSINFALKPLYEHHRYRLYRISLSAPTEPPSEIEGVVFRIVEAWDRDAIQQIEDNSEWLKGTIHARIEGGACCIAAFKGRQLAAFNLVSFGRVYIPLVDVTRTFGLDEAWSEQISTVHRFHRKGLASQLRFRMFETLRARGIRMFYGGAPIDNLASLALARRVGFQEFAEIRFTRIIRVRRWRCVRIGA